MNYPDSASGDAQSKKSWRARAYNSFHAFGGKMDNSPTLRRMRCSLSSVRGKKRVFSVNGREYHYLFHIYNNSWQNERIVEVPLIWQCVVDALSASPRARILELGNVLSHYFEIQHDVLDKYEVAPKVVNEDAVTYRSSVKYDLIVSISTVEHIGFDESEKEPEKPLKAIDNLLSMLAPDGRMVITLPIGYNPNTDRFLKEGRIPHSEQYCLKRISRNNRWREASWEEIADSKFGRPFRNANAVVVLVLRNPNKF